MPRPVVSSGQSRVKCGEFSESKKRKNKRRKINFRIFHVNPAHPELNCNFLSHTFSFFNDFPQPPGEGMNLCYSCRHAFPASSLTPCAFSDIVSHRMDAVHNIIDAMKAETPEEKHQILKLQSALRELCSAIHQEFTVLKGGAPREDAPKKKLPGHSTEMPLITPRRKGSVIAQQATLSSAATIAKHPQGAVTARATFNGAVPNYKLRKMNSTLELVSASIYCVLESAAIRARAAVALLWVTPPGAVSAELVAPFVVGPDVCKLRNSAPYRVCETSIPCVVTEFGIALNIKPKHGVVDTRVSEDSPLVELIETSNAAQLLVPIFTRYGEIQRSVLGVLHLLGSPVVPCAFSPRNEEMAVQTAATLSIIMSSHHELMGGEWANRIYDPSLLVSASAYQGALDMRSMQKIVDDFSPPATLIYRCVNGREADDDVREEVKMLRNAMAKRAVPPKVVNSVRDLQRFAATMEQNWVGLLGTVTEMENRINTLEENALRTDLPKRAQGTSSSLEQATQLASDSNFVQSPRSRSPSTIVLPSLHDARGMIKPEQLNSFEIAAAQRFSALGGDPSLFVTEKEA
uniref:Uncharacterized protein n=1 Tax=Trypanosoma congolense (strain IL3000) TaxID=1068625 RepID=G0UWY0_TRYCI|nr:conserved hypothetical protein [Trypanosoma congolense IL3000]